MQIIVVLILSFQAQWTYLLPTRWVPNDYVCQLFASEKFACIACTCIESSKALFDTPHIPNFTLCQLVMVILGLPQVVNPRQLPRAIQLTVKYPTFNWEQG